MALATKPRWDKYDGYVGNHRSTLAASIDLENQSNKVLAVGNNSQGATVVGGGQTGVNGVMIIPVGADIHGTLLDGGINNQAGDRCDVGAHGEITNFVAFNAAAPGTPIPATAGTNYYGHPDGSVLASTGAGAVYVGHTNEADRLIVDVSANGPATAIQNNNPVGLAAVGGDDSASVSWTPVKSATQYKIFKSTDGTTFVAATPATVAAPASSATVTGLAAGLTYFRIVATVGGVDSGNSNVATATVV